MKQEELAAQLLHECPPWLRGFIDSNKDVANELLEIALEVEDDLAEICAHFDTQPDKKSLQDSMFEQRLEFDNIVRRTEDHALLCAAKENLNGVDRTERIDALFELARVLKRRALMRWNDYLDKVTE